jgi:ABC-type branched-subunit amino acid transport system substrate-binding protein
MSRRVWRVIALTLAVTLVAAACGDSDDDEPSDTTGATDTTAPSETTETTAASDTTAPTETSGDAAGTGAPADLSEIGTVRIGLAYGVTDAALESITSKAILAVETAEALAEEAGMDVEVVLEDTAGDPVQAVDAANALVAQNPSCILGAARSSESTAIVPVAKEAQVPQISWGSTSAALTTIDDDDFFFRALISDTAQGDVAGKYVHDVVGATTAAVVVQNDPYGLGLGDAFTESFTAAGGEVVDRVNVDTGTTDFSAEVDAIVAAAPDVIYNVLFGPEFIPFVQELAQADPAAVQTLFTADAQNNTDATAGIEDLLAGVMGTRPTGVPLTEFIEYYTAETGEEPGTFTEYSFDAAMVCLVAAAAAGSNEGVAVRDAMRDVTNGGTEYTFDQAVEMLQAAAAGEDVDYHGAGSTLDLDENGDVDATGATYTVYVFNPDGTVSDEGTVLTYGE